MYPDDLEQADAESLAAELNARVAAGHHIDMQAPWILKDSAYSPNSCQQRLGFTTMSDLIPLTKGAHGFGSSYDGHPLGSLGLMATSPPGAGPGPGRCAVTDRVSGSLVRLPRFTQLTAEEQGRVVDGVLSYQVAASVTDRKGTAGRSDSAP
ncbi:hypothetical protein EV643_104377 [Kribbella sp. VKM Ac-2527]|uniref:Uncharacterized protein n=1 Tax=Kribbella caucasensis TaxID=2512215 RepID=A0A4R6KJF1_9ACTN|nr:hypothetical protein [Kribbella sp. VKM Ac-2527]TDO50877.1 hypothetical protein EV643_104377 [Kribbella sp. VKM Ac-2527]